MAQVYDRTRKFPMTCSGNNKGVSVAVSGNTEILNIDTIDVDRIFVEIAVTTNALDAFLIQAKANREGSTLTLYSTTGDFTSPAGALVGASGDLTGIAAGTSGWFILDTRGIANVIVQASAAVGAATVSVYFQGS